MARTATEPRIVVFAKAPEPGTVKTRLIPPLSPDNAAGLHARLVKRALSTARTAAPGMIELACAPDADHPFFRYCGVRYGAVLKSQVQGDLGARMLAAAQRVLAGGNAVILIGSDCPALTHEHLRAASHALRHGQDAVIAPAEDGGYVLLGLTRTDQVLFRDIAWGSAQVMAATRQRLDALGWRWSELETLWDVDRPEDYERLIASGMLEGQQGLGEESVKRFVWPSE